MSNLVIQTNVLALNSHRNLRVIGVRQAQASARLSSGYRINSAADDAAGLAISEKMRAQIRGLDQASRNAQDGISLVQTAEGGMQEINNMLQRIRELIVQASNDTNDQVVWEDGKETTVKVQQTQGDRQKLQEEIEQLIAGVDSMARQVEFNNKVLLDGTYSAKNHFAGSVGGLTQEEIDLMKQKLAGELSSLVGNVVNSAAETVSINMGILNWAGDLLDGLALASMDLGTFQGNNVTASGFSYALAGGGTVAWTGLAAGNAATQVIESSLYFPTIMSNLHAFMTNDTYGAGLFTLDSAIFGTIDSQNGANLINSLSSYVGGLDLALSNLNIVYDAMSNVFGTDASAQLSVISKYITEVTGKRDALEAALSDYIEVNTKALEFFEWTNKTADRRAEAHYTGGLDIYLQTGANAFQGLTFNIESVTSRTLGLGNGFAHLDNGKNSTYINIVQDSGVKVTPYINMIDASLTQVTTERAKLGAIQNRLEFTKNSLEISSENLSASESRIRDADMAKEMMRLTAANVLQQAGVSMLAQANQAPQSVLQLLR